MMVVHDDTEAPVEVAVIRKPVLEQKSYVIVKNHVRELINTDEGTSSVSTNNENSPQKQNVSKKKQKTGKKLKNIEQIPAFSAESNSKTNSESDIDKTDLQELRTVYMKCKEVINKIETKYGHLLDLDYDEGPRSFRKRKMYTTETSEEECDCQLKKKIVFDDEGKQSTVETVSEKHICVKKYKKRHSGITTRSKNISVEYTENETTLPDNLQELDNLLKDPYIEKPLRNKIVYKMKALKQEYVNDIRFNKHALIEKLKANPDEVLGFEGTNLSTIPGYS